MKLKHLAPMVLALTLSVATQAQDTIPQRDTTGRDTTTIPEKKDTLLNAVAMNQFALQQVNDTIPERDTTGKDTTQKDTTMMLAVLNQVKDTTTLPKKDTTDLPKKDTTSGYALINKRTTKGNNTISMVYIKERLVEQDV